MLYDYLTKHYAVNEPIFLSDIHLPDITNNYLRQMFKQLCDSGKLKRFHAGVYYLTSSDSSFPSAPLSARTVAEHKYIQNGTDISGYYLGQSFAAQLNLCPAPINLLEIVTNHTSGKYREIYLDDVKIILRKPKFQVTNDNWKTLQFLDFLKDIELYADVKSDSTKEKIQNYILENQITKETISPYISEYPDKIYRMVYDLELYDALKESYGNFFVSIQPKGTSLKPNPAKQRRGLSIELL